MSSGLSQMFDLKDEAQAKEYLDTVGVEYRFQCYHEKKPDGCHRLADFLDAFKKDTDKAKKVYELNCTENKYGQSCFKFANFNLLGKGGKKDKEKALEYYDLSCKYGHAPGCHNKGLMYHSGKATGKHNYAEASKCFEEGCSKGDAGSCQFLSTYYITGQEGIPKDMKKAFQFASKACELGHIYGCVNLSQMYKKGDGIEKNMEKSEEFKEKAKVMQRELTDVPKTLEFGK